MKALLIGISTALVLTSSLIYIYSILKGRSKPHRTTRFVLLVITVLSTTALLSNHGAAFVLSFLSMLQAVSLFVLSLRRGMGGWAKLDITCLIIAAIGIIFWQLSGQPLIGLMAAIVADTVGMIPALVKTYKQPDTEIWHVFAMDAVAGLLSIFALANYTFYSLSYPLYILVINLIMVVIILCSKPLHAMIKTDEKAV